MNALTTGTFAVNIGGQFFDTTSTHSVLTWSSCRWIYELSWFAMPLNHIEIKCKKSYFTCSDLKLFGRLLKNIWHCYFVLFGGLGISSLIHSCSDFQLFVSLLSMLHDKLVKKSQLQYRCIDDVTNLSNVLSMISPLTKWLGPVFIRAGNNIASDII